MQANFILTGNPDSLAGYRVARIDGAKSHTLTGFYDEIARALEFPDYFGYNLDSLDELLNDLSWIKENRIALFITGSEHFIENDPDHQRLQDVLELFDEAAGNWKKFGLDENKTFPGKELKIVFSPNESVRDVLQDLDIGFEVI